MKRIILIVMALTLLVLLSVSCQEPHVAAYEDTHSSALEAYVETEQALDAEFQEVINAWKQTFSTRDDRGYTSNFDTFIDGLDVIAKYRLTPSIYVKNLSGNGSTVIPLRIVQLLPGTDIIRLSWEEGQ